MDVVVEAVATPLVIGIGIDSESNFSIFKKTGGEGRARAGAGSRDMWEQGMSRRRGAKVGSRQTCSSLVPTEFLWHLARFLLPLNMDAKGHSPMGQP